MLIIVEDFERPSKDIVEGFKKLPTPVVSDAMGRQLGMVSDIKPLFPEATMAGPALTVKTYTADNLMCHLGIKLAQAGDVLVVEAGGYVDAALWGEVMSTAAQRKGIAGVVIDGGVRDRLPNIELKFPVFARGVIPKGTFKDSPGCLNVPISCGGLAVCPGDIIVGDADGVVVVPKQVAKEVLGKAQAALEKEEVMKERLAKGEIPYDFLGLGKLLEREDVKWIKK
jgi:4-hydroxy-4-methyl-2-oxoglutarate aldolase